MQFSIANGKLIDPAGKPFVARGLNNRPADSGTAAAILKLNPGITFVRLAMSTFADPAAWNPFVSLMEAAGVVCEAEYHPWPMQTALSGSALASEAAWAASWAKYYAGRPYVWVGSMNEPQGGLMTPEHVAVYNAVRAADPTKMVMLVCGIGGGNPGAVGAGSLTPSAYGAMTNIVWDLHFYGWSSQYNTNQATVTAMLTGDAGTHVGVRAAQAITSADGLVPVIIGEFGPSTSGSAADANAAQVLNAVLSNTDIAGYAGWAWNPDPFNALQNNGQLTAWGTTLAAAIKAGGGVAVPAHAESAQGTAIAKAADPPIYNTAGDAWTMTSDGRVAVNATTDGTTANVTGMVYNQRRVVQTNQAGNTYSKALASDVWRQDSTAAPPASGGWIAAQLAAGPALASGQRMRYAVLLPTGWAPGRKCPVLMWMHTNDSGNRAYPNGDVVAMAQIIGADGWFNTAAFQAKYPNTIVVCPACDQTTDSGGTLVNFGGYGPVNAANEQSLVLIAAEVVAKYGGDSARVYGAGGSLGGICAWGLAIDHNAVNGQISRTFAAVVAEAGMLVRDGVTPASVLAQIQTVPIFAVHGISDTTSPLTWDRAVWDSLSGGKPRPGAPGARAGTSAFWYLEDATLGHDVWDTYTPTGAGGPVYDWLFAQAAPGAVVSKPPVPVPSHLTTAQQAEIDAIVTALTGLGQRLTVLRNG